MAEENYFIETMDFILSLACFKKQTRVSSLMLIIFIESTHLVTHTVLLYSDRLILEFHQDLNPHGTVILIL